MNEPQFPTSKRLKPAKSLLSIKEFSEMSGLEQSTLRYWDDIGLFSPAHRNPDNSYRYYSPEQIILVNFIKVLSSLHIPLKVIASVSENRTPEDILRLMEQQETILDQEITRLHEAHSTIHTLRDVMRQGLEAPDAEHISVRRLASMPISLGPLNEPWEGLNFYQSFIRFCQYAKVNRFNTNNPIGGYYNSMEHFLRTPSVPSRFFSVDPRGNDVRAAGNYLVGYAQGYYGELSEATRRLDDFAAQQGLKLNGPVYVLYLRDEISVKDTADYLAQICIALEPPDHKGATGW